MDSYRRNDNTNTNASKYNVEYTTLIKVVLYEG